MQRRTIISRGPGKRASERRSSPYCGTALMLAGLLFGATSAWAVPPDNEPHTLKGVVERFNYSPQGCYESMLFKSSEALVQVNFPPHMAAEMTKVVTAGDQISVVAVAERSKGDHPIYRLQKLTSAKGEEIVMLEPKPGEHPQHKNLEKIEGTIKYLNYARRGEVNGVIFESGDFVHFGPHGARLVKLAMGQKLVVEYVPATTPDGHKVIEHPVSANGVEIPHGPPRHAPGGPGPKHPHP